MIEDNIILKTDSYKVSHAHQYPPNTTQVTSYLCSRQEGNPTLVAGFQGMAKKYLTGKVVTRAKIEEAAAFYEAHFGTTDNFNREGWEHILEAHDGHLPIEVRSVPEGTVVDGNNAIMTVTNTDPKCWWLPNYLETLLVQLWYPITVASQSWRIRRLINAYLDKNGDPAGAPFKLHDFGYRGVSSDESAGIGGFAHLINFMGTDNVAALVYANNYYGEDMAGFSIPASEHSTMTSWGQENEAEAYRNMLELYPTGLVACVSDSYDIFNACDKIWGEELHAEIMERDGTLVIRPDSGDPVEVIMELLPILADKFGFTVNEKGYKVLDPHVRLIQGDGVDEDTIGIILAMMDEHGWSADNIAFGMGGALLQRLDRDTMKFAFKCSGIVVDGEWRDVSKSPVGAPWKASRSGRLDLTIQDGVWVTFDWNKESGKSAMQTVFYNGQLMNETTLEDIRARASAPLEPRTIKA